MGVLAVKETHEKICGLVWPGIFFVVGIYLMSVLFSLYRMTHLDLDLTPQHCQESRLDCL